MVHVVDIHTHMYPPSYISLLSTRTSTPYIHHPQQGPPRLIILPSDDDPAILQDDRGRPVDSSYSDVSEKIKFMRMHSIHTSVISLANPWLDFLPPDKAAQTALEIAQEMEAMCEAQADGQLFFFGTLPLSTEMDDVLGSLRAQVEMKHVRGIIIGTTGLGKGLDDPRMDPLWEELSKGATPMFIHPHYGLPKELYGPRAEESGHVMPLALGFPLETTIAFTRMYLAGVFDRFLGLKVVLAHAGGAIPFLAGRLDSCVKHERKFRDEKGSVVARRGIWEVMKQNVWLDGVIYDKVGLKAAVEAVGKERVLFGTDHPFFPPLDESEGLEWASVRMNVDAVRGTFGHDVEGAQGVLGMNAERLFGLPDHKGTSKDVAA